MSHKKKILSLCLMLIILLLQIGITIAFAEGDEKEEIQTYNTKQENTDFIFVIDFSYSMTENDRHRIVLQMIESCIDAFYTDKVRVGFVAYNDSILNYAPPTAINSRETREDLKGQINSVTRSGYTDIGLALTTAGELVRQYSIPEGRQSRIILLSDGETDLSNSKNGRTKDQSITEMYQMAQYCKDAGITIDCIAFGEYFDGETSDLNSISVTSGGQMYIARTPDILIDIFGEMIEKTTFSRLKPVSVTIAGGDEQTVELPTANSFSDEVNVLVVSSSPIQDVTILYSGDEITYSRSNYYFTCKILSPKDENIRLQMIGAEGQEIKIYLVLYKDFERCLEFPRQVEKNLPWNYLTYVNDLKNKDSMMTDSFFASFQEIVKITDSDGNEEVLTVNSDEDQFSKELNYHLSGEYKVGIELVNDYFYVDIQDIPITVSNNPPYGDFPDHLKFQRKKMEKYYDLNDYFFDDNGDLLTYEILPLDGKLSNNVFIKDNQLVVNLQQKGESTFTLQITDAEGEQFESDVIIISVLPFWRYHFGIIFGSLIVIAMLGIYGFLILKKNKVMIKPEEEKESIAINLNAAFDGKLNVYFIKAPNGMEIDPLTFALYQIKENKVSLGQLLESLDIPLARLDADQMFFLVDINRQIIFHHNSKSNVMIGSSIACKKIKYSINFGNKIYITSQDGEYEIELHYLSIRS